MGPSALTEEEIFDLCDFSGEAEINPPTHTAASLRFSERKQEGRLPLRTDLISYEVGALLRMSQKRTLAETEIFQNTAAWWVNWGPPSTSMTYPTKRTHAHALGTAEGWGMRGPPEGVLESEPPSRIPMIVAERIARRPEMRRIFRSLHLATSIDLR